MRLDRASKILAEDGFQGRFDVLPEGISDIDLLARDG
jgi:hypothetical protein